MHDWKGHDGISDQAAGNAGVYGTPTSTYQVDQARAAEALLRAAPSPPSYPSPDPYPSTQHTPGTHYVPSSSGRDYRPLPTGSSASSPGILRRIFMILFVWPFVLALVVSVLFTGWQWLPALVALSASQMESSVPALNTAHYERLSEDARRLSSQSTSRLYEAKLKGTSPNWNSLNEDQRQSVAAAWIRYTRNPDSFRRLKIEQRTYIFAAFRSYLTELVKRGDKHASADLQRLASTPR